MATTGTRIALKVKSSKNCTQVSNSIDSRWNSLFHVECLLLCVYLAGIKSCNSLTHCPKSGNNHFTMILPQNFKLCVNQFIMARKPS